MPTTNAALRPQAKLAAVDRSSHPYSRADAGTSPHVFQSVQNLGWLRFLTLVFLPFSFGYFIAYFMRNINATLAPLIVSELSLGPASLGALTAVFFWSNALALVPVGIAIDHYGPGRVQIVLLSVAAVGMVLHAIAESIIALTVARCLSGIGFTNSLGAGMKAIALWGPPRHTAALNGLFLCLGTLGAIAATAPAEYLLAVITWRGLFLILAVMTALGAALATLQPSVPIAHNSASSKVVAQGFRHILRDPWFRKFAPLSGLVVGTSWALQGLWVSRWFADVALLPRKDVVTYLTIMAIALSASALLMGLATQFARRRGVGYGALLSGFGLALLAAEIALASGSAPTLAPWCAIASLGGCVVIGMSANAEHFEKAVLGRANALLSIYHMVFAFVIQAGFGVLLSTFDQLPDGGYSPAAYRWMFMCLAGLQVLATVHYITTGAARKGSTG